MSRDKELFYTNVAQTSDFPLGLEIVDSDGNYLIDKEGKRYLDLISGISVNNLGHKHPNIIESIKIQLNKYLHVMVYGEFVLKPQVEYAKLLTDNLPKNLNSVYFVNSGSEATEGALKLAKRITRRNEVVTFKNSYHGNTAGALSVTGQEELKNSFRPLIPGTKQIEFNNVDQLSIIKNGTACVIVEPIQGEAGGIVGRQEFLKELRNVCNRTGALLIFDEIQTGFGRTGKLFAFQHYNIVPDILLLGKAFGGGLPLAAFISDKKIMSALKTDPMLGHITTFGGNPVCCAAGKACLEILLSENYINEANEKEHLFRKLLVHSDIEEIRGKGLLLVIQLKDKIKIEEIVSRCVKKGLIVDRFLFNRNAIRIAPPLTITEEEISLASKTIIEALA